MQSLHISQWGTFILQQWMMEFNSSHLLGMKMPTWITLKSILLVSNAQDITQCLRIVQDYNKGNRFGVDQKFCIALTNRSPYYLTIGAFNPVMKTFFYIQLDYDNIPIQYRYYLSIEYLIRNYSITYNQKNQQLLDCIHKPSQPQTILMHRKKKVHPIEIKKMI